jgi:hypothetical protein
MKLNECLFKFIAETPEGEQKTAATQGGRDPDQRYQTAAEALAALRPVSDTSERNRPAAHPDNTNGIMVTMNFCPKNRSELNRLLEEFKEKTRKLGVQVKVESKE